MPERTGLLDKILGAFKKRPIALPPPTERDLRLQSYLVEVNGLAQKIGYREEETSNPNEPVRRIYDDTAIRAMSKEERQKLKDHLWSLTFGNSMMPIGSEVTAEPIVLKRIIDEVENKIQQDKNNH